MTPNTGRRTVLYLRVSTVAQAEGGHSLDGQRARLEAFAAEHGLEVMEVIVDGGVSGGSLVRPGMARVRELAAAGDFDVLLAAKGDRVARSLRDFLNLCSELRENGVVLALADEAFRADDPASELTLQIRQACAQYELSLIRQRVREGLQAARDKGQRLGRPPCGWAIQNGQWMKTDRHAVVARAHELRATGMRYLDIAHALDSEGWATGSGRAGTRWHKGSVARLLKSPLTM